jgi:hypothetical protein
MPHRLTALLAAAFLVAAGANAVRGQGDDAECARLTKCPAPTYLKVEPDLLGEAWSSRVKCRLVIGAGKYRRDPSLNRDFIKATALEVDDALHKAGYTKSLGLLVDEDATYDKVWEALQSVGRQPSRAVIVVYYIGHGLPTTTNDDLRLGVAEETLARGPRVKEFLAEAVRKIDSTITTVPRILFVFESCHSAAGAPFRDYDQIVEGMQIDLKRLAFLSATSRQQLASKLKGDTVSAFGRYFADALKGHWSCADRLADGALEIKEVAEYISSRLHCANREGLLDGGAMDPQFVDRAGFSIVSYESSRVADEVGYRRRIRHLYSVEADAPAGTSIVITANGAVVKRCPGGPNPCRIVTDNPTGISMAALRPEVLHAMDGSLSPDIRISGDYRLPSPPPPTEFNYKPDAGIYRVSFTQQSKGRVSASIKFEYGPFAFGGSYEVP